MVREYDSILLWFDDLAPPVHLIALIYFVCSGYELFRHPFLIIFGLFCYVHHFSSVRFCTNNSVKKIIFFTVFRFSVGYINLFKEFVDFVEILSYAVCFPFLEYVFCIDSNDL